MGSAVKPESLQPEKPKAEKPKAEKKIAKKAAGKCVGQTLRIKLPSGAEFEGLCTGERKIHGGEQVFLQLKGLVSRYFNAQDIVK